MTDPQVSVLLPVYNGGRFLREAIDSILGQSYADFELIVVNDGSTDDTHDIVSSYADPRLRYIRQDNCGLSATLNKAIGLARGRYLARQDSDDLSYPERLKRQVEYLDAHPTCGLVGTWAEIWVEGERTSRAHRHPADNPVLQFLLLFNNPFVHSSVMMRREAVQKVGPYLSDRSRKLPEDYELWSRIARHYELANIPELLHVYREVGGSICRENWDRLMDEVVAISATNLRLRVGLRPHDANAVDLAAMWNVVYRKASFLPSLKAMERIYFAGADSIRTSAGGDTASLDETVRVQWVNIRANYYRYLVTGRLEVFFRRLVGRR